MLKRSNSFVQNGESEWLAKLELLGDLTVDQKKAVTCAVHGHSAIVGGFIEHVNCGRCGSPLSGKPFSKFSVKENPVYIGDMSEENKLRYSKLDWVDLLFTDDPFYVVPLENKNEIGQLVQKLSGILNETNEDGSLNQHRLSESVLTSLIEGLRTKFNVSYVTNVKGEGGRLGEDQVFLIMFTNGKCISVMRTIEFRDNKPRWVVSE